MKIKKILAVVLSAVIIFTFAGCSSKQYTDKEVTVPVTDENGEQVTDENGEVVTELIEAPEEESGKTEDNSDKDNADSKDNKGKKPTSDKKGSDKTSSGKTTSKKSDSKKPAKTTSTTKPTTTKPVKRDIDLTVIVPFYSQTKDTVITVKYRVKGEKYKTLEIEDNELTLGHEQTLEYKIKKVKGDVDIIVTLDGVDLRENKVRVPADEKSATLRLVTGIEMLDGGWD